MSRTIRNNRWKRDGMGRHKSALGSAKTDLTKFKNGPGGINCPCCTRLPPDELKIKQRRAIRRKLKQNIVKEIDQEF